MRTILLGCRPPPWPREPTPILCPRYQRSAARWAIGIYLAAAATTPNPNCKTPSGLRLGPRNKESMTPSYSTRGLT